MASLKESREVPGTGQDWGESVTVIHADGCPGRSAQCLLQHRQHSELSPVQSNRWVGGLSL